MAIISLLAAGYAETARAATIFIDFEGLPDSTILTNQYAGLTFTNAIILTSGISLNEFEFPPHSGVNVVSDNGGPISISFDSPILSFSGYFTYVEPLTVDAFDSGANLVDSATSAFSSNDALFGDPGSSPNEFLQVDFAGGISSVTITGDPLGGSFVMDDTTFQTASVPEPRSIFLFLGGAVALFTLRRKFLLMRQKLLIGAALLAGFLIIGGECYLLARPALRVENPISAPARMSPTQSRSAPSATPLVAKPAATITPTVGTPSVTPSLITVNTSTAVTVNVQISPAPIAGGVNLLRLGATGTQPTILGVMHNDGTSDGVYTLQVNFNEPSAGQIQLQVSAAFAGVLKRVVSPPITLAVWNALSVLPGINAATLSYPPSWATSVDNTASEQYLSPSSSPADPDEEYVADIIVDEYANPSDVDLSTFYNTLADINYYQESDGSSAFITSNGFPAVLFTNISSMIPTDIIAVNTGRAIIQISDVGEQHRADGILKSIANSIR